MGIVTDNSSTKKPIKVAIVGAGSMALEHIKAFQSLEDVEICGIFSRTLDKASTLASLYHIPLVADSLDELFHKTHADLVVVTVFEMAMRDTLIACSAYPWTIFAEKPTGYTLDQAKDVQRNTKSSNIYVGLNRRFLSSSLYLKNKLDELGSNRLIKVQDQQDLNLAKSIGHPESVCEHWMYANSIHLVDYFSYLCRGDVNEIQHILPYCDDPKSKCMMLIHLKFTSGDEGIYEALWQRPGPWAVTAWCDDMRFDARPLERLSYQVGWDRTVHEVPVDVIDQTYKPGFVRQSMDVIKAIKGEITSSPTLTDAIKTMTLIHSLYNK